MCRKLKTSTLLKRILQERIDGCNATAARSSFTSFEFEDEIATAKLQTYKEVITLIEQIEGSK
jgi:hypothetical protein